MCSLICVDCNKMDGQKEVESILDKFSYDTSHLISIMQDLQKEFGFLDEKHLAFIAEKLGMSYSHVYSVATFYNSFKFSKQGKFVISVCKGTACHVKGSDTLYEFLKKHLKVKDNETTKDGLFTLVPVNCLGACSLAPCIMVNGKVHGKLNTEKLEMILGILKKEAEKGHHD